MSEDRRGFIKKASALAAAPLLPGPACVQEAIAVRYQYLFEK